MSHPEGTRAWRELSDTHNSHGEPVPNEEPVPVVETADARPIDTVSSSVRRAVYAIHPELESIVDAALLPLDRPLHLCPECVGRYAHDERGARQSGRCRVCILRAFAQRYEDHEAELLARAAANASKKRLERTRDAIDPDRPRGHKPFRVCLACGERLPKRSDYDFDYCLECRELHERRGRSDEQQQS